MPRDSDLDALLSDGPLGTKSGRVKELDALLADEPPSTRSAPASDVSVESIEFTPRRLPLPQGGDRDTSPDLPTAFLKSSARGLAELPGHIVGSVRENPALLAPIGLGAAVGGFPGAMLGLMGGGVIDAGIQAMARQEPVAGAMGDAAYRTFLPPIAGLQDVKAELGDVPADVAMEEWLRRGAGAQAFMMGMPFAGRRGPRLPTGTAPRPVPPPPVPESPAGPRPPRPVVQRLGPGDQPFNQRYQEASTGMPMQAGAQPHWTVRGPFRPPTKPVAGIPIAQALEQYPAPEMTGMPPGGQINRMRHARSFMDPYRWQQLPEPQPPTTPVDTAQMRGPEAYQAGPNQVFRGRIQSPEFATSDQATSSRLFDQEATLKTKLAQAKREAVDLEGVLNRPELQDRLSRIEGQLRELQERRLSSESVPLGADAIPAPRDVRVPEQWHQGGPGESVPLAGEAIPGTPAGGFPPAGLRNGVSGPVEPTTRRGPVTDIAPQRQVVGKRQLEGGIPERLRVGQQLEGTLGGDQAQPPPPAAAAPPPAPPPPKAPFVPFQTAPGRGRLPKSGEFRILEDWKPATELKVPDKKPTNVMKDQAEAFQATAGHPQHVPFLRESGIVTRGLEGDFGRRQVVDGTIQRAHNMTFEEYQGLADWFQANPDATDIPRKLFKQKTLVPREVEWLKTQPRDMLERLRALSKQWAEAGDEMAATGLSREKEGYWAIRGRDVVGELTRSPDDITSGELRKNAQGEIELTFQKPQQATPERDPNPAASWLRRYIEHAQALTTQRDIHDAIKLHNDLLKQNRRGQAAMVENYMRYNLMGEMTWTEQAFRNAELDRVLAQDLPEGTTFDTKGQFYEAKGKVKVKSIRPEDLEKPDGKQLYEITVNGEDWPIRYRKEDLLAMKHEDTLFRKWTSMQYWMDGLHRVAYDIAVLGSPRNVVNQMEGNFPRVVAALGESGAAMGTLKVINELRKKDPATMKEWQYAGILTEGARQMMDDPSTMQRFGKIEAGIGKYTNAVPDFFSKAVVYTEAKSQLAAKHPDWTSKKVRAQAMLEMAIATDFTSRAVSPPLKMQSNLGRASYFLHESLFRSIEQILTARDYPTMARLIAYKAPAAYVTLKAAQAMGAELDMQDLKDRILVSAGLYGLADQQHAGGWELATLTAPGVVAKKGADVAGAIYESARGRATTKDWRDAIPFSAGQQVFDAAQGMPYRMIAVPKRERLKFPGDEWEERRRRKESREESKERKRSRGTGF